jgi:hypothetical protein
MRLSLPTLFSLLLAVILLAAPPPSLAQPAAGGGQVLAGKVLETMNSAGYTYMLVASGGLQQWVAIPETSVAVGAEVRYHPGMTMTDFHSKTLDKTFASIIFSAGLAEAEAVPATAAAKTSASFAAALQGEQQAAPLVPDKNAMSPGSGGAVVPMVEVSVPRAEGDAGRTVGEIFAKAGELQGKTVRVRGKVVKVSRAIMGKNWVHLQDGTGNALNNSHDLVLAGDADPAEGDIVVMEGVVAADKDFGAGYKYSAIVLEAKVLP